MVTATLLSDVRNYLDITFEDEETEPEAKWNHRTWSGLSG